MRKNNDAVVLDGTSTRLVQDSFGLIFLAVGSSMTPGEHLVSPEKIEYDEEGDTALVTVKVSKDVASINF